MEKFIYQGAEYNSVRKIKQIPTICSINGLVENSADGQIPHMIKGKFNSSIDIISYRSANLPPSIETYRHALTISGVIQNMLDDPTMVLPLTIMDVGTGSGVIPITLSRHLREGDRKNVEIIGTDISGLALEVADINLQINGISNVKLRKRDMLDVIVAEFGKIDVLISNPPYFRTGDIDPLLRAVEYVPLSAIDGGCDGVDFYKRLLSESRNVLSNQGIIVLQHQSCQLGQICTLVVEYLPGRTMAAINSQRNGPTATIIGPRERIFNIEAPFGITVL